MKSDKPFDVLIIGSGIGGLSAGIILSRLNFRVAVIEKNALLGGLLRSYRRGGLDCPVGVHYFGAFGEDEPLRRMCDFLGVTERMAVERMGCGGPIDRYLFDDFTFDLPEGIDAFAAALTESFPEDLKVIAAIAKNLHVMADMQNSFTFLSSAPFSLDMNYFATLEAYLTKMDCSPGLRNVLGMASSWMGMDQIDCPVFYHHLALVSYLLSSWRLKGRGSDLAAAFVTQLEALGGCFILGDSVTVIIANGKEIAGVRLASGRVLKAPRVVAAIHPKAVLPMLPEGIVKPLQARRIKGLTDTEGLFVVSVAVDAKAHPALPYNVYRLHADGEGGIADGGFYQLLAGTEEKNLLMMITTSPFSEWRHWENTTTGRRGADYAEEKGRRATRMLAEAEAIFGDLAGAQVLDAYTPLTLRDWTNSPQGSPYGIRRSLHQLPAAATLHRPPLAGLHFAGQNALAPGILGTLMGSFQTVKQMIGPERFARDVFVHLCPGQAR